MISSRDARVRGVVEAACAPTFSPPCACASEFSELSNDWRPYIFESKNSDLTASPRGGESTLDTLLCFRVMMERLAFPPCEVPSGFAMGSALIQSRVGILTPPEDRINKSRASMSGPPRSWPKLIGSTAKASILSPLYDKCQRERLRISGSCT